MAANDIFIEVTQKRYDKRSKIEAMLTNTTAALLMIGAAIVALITSRCTTLWKRPWASIGATPLSA